jgi:NTE family protein
MSKTALVLSAGGMFGAYQAGVWQVLSDCFEPDMVVGASIGAVNGWAIAGGTPPDELIGRWLTLECARRYNLQAPRSLHGGILNSRPLRAMIDEVYTAYRPRVTYALVVTEIARLRPRIFQGPEITADLLKATTAIPCLFDQVRVDGTLYSDGGVLNALPIWAAAELGAGRIVAVNALAMLPGLIPKVFVKIVRSLSRFQPPESNVEVIKISPAGVLGNGRDALCWSRKKAEEWIELGRRDALAQKHSIRNCFERK